ncbi:thiamine pyrophosphate-dependent enzyme [Nonomuraea dietziae]|uniref:thiamine pyrophosphate-dependent enzyme n=1 Tax=Nonomuraea dietziae TaxID=65515 RepID=UPI003CD09C0C
MGAVYEALNLAALWALPLLVVVENNGIAQSTPTDKHLAGTIAGRAAAFGLPHELVEGADVDDIRARLAPLVSGVRAGRPAVVEFVTHRLGPHSKGDDTRPAHAVGVDWRDKYASPRLDRLEAAAVSRIEAVAADVIARPLSRWEAR